LHIAERSTSRRFWALESPRETPLVQVIDEERDWIAEGPVIFGRHREHCEVAHCNNCALTVCCFNCHIRQTAHRPPQLNNVIIAPACISTGRLEIHAEHDAVPGAAGLIEAGGAFHTLWTARGPRICVKYTGSWRIVVAPAPASDSLPEANEAGRKRGSQHQ
jgi:hypothetical protein